MKNIGVFSSENFQFLEIKFSIYLNRRVFVMLCAYICLKSKGIYVVTHKSILLNFCLLANSY